MSRASDYFKYYEIAGATALATDILAGEVGYIAGGKVIGQGVPPSGSLTAFYITQDATITPDKVAAWKTAYGKAGLILGTYYPGPVPATGGLFGVDIEVQLYAPIDDTFTI